MIRIKTLSLPLIAALLGAAELPANAQVALNLSSRATYRQFAGERDLLFTGGRFDINFRDGSVTSIGGCNSAVYNPPGFFRTGPCSPGTSGFLTTGTLAGATLASRYLLVTAINSAVAVAPRRADLVRLRAAPASGLPRPSGGFTDNSVSLYFNLHTSASIREYILTGYNASRQYNSGERAKFTNQIVPGVYYYSFPRLSNPLLPAPINAMIYPMAEGSIRKNSKDQGFKFTNSNSYDDDGFMKLSTTQANIIQWRPLGRNIVFLGADSLYFSIRPLTDPTDPTSPTDGASPTIFPPFANDGDQRVLLANPLVSQFTLPPIFEVGTKGVVEVQLVRALQTGAVTYDYSDRKFQIPVIFVD